MLTIAVFIANYNIDYSPSILNFLDFLSEGNRVDLFLRNLPMKNSSLLRRRSIRPIDIRPPFSWTRLAAAGKRRLGNFIKGYWHGVFLPSHALEYAKRTFPNPAYHCLIAFDAAGLELCKDLFPQARPFFYCLELELLSEVDGAGDPDGKRQLLEKLRTWSGDISGLIIQSAEREKLFRTEYGLPAAVPVLHLPVTYPGGVASRGRRWLQEKFALPERSRIALHLGGAHPFYSSLEISAVFAALPEWCLFFQGNHLRGYGAEIRALAKRRGAENIIVSNSFLTELADVDRYLQSADVGIAWYNDRNANFRSAGFSSGKIAAYLRFGLPVLANDSASTRQAIGQTGCGLCVGQVAEIPAALNEIVSRYPAMSAAAQREYELRYWFEPYRRRLAEFLHLT